MELCERIPDLKDDGDDDDDNVDIIKQEKRVSMLLCI